MLRNNHQRAKQVATVYLLSVVASIGLCLVDGFGLTRADWPVNGQGVTTYLTLNTFYVRLFLLLVKFGLIIGGYVVLIRWLRRAYYNLHQLPDVYPEYPDGWAAGAWFVPFINLVRPFTIMREVWQFTQRAAFSQVAVPTTLLGWWWGVHLVNSTLSTAIARSNADATSPEVALKSEIISQLFSIAAAVLTWRVVQRAATFEDALTYRLKLETLGQPQELPSLAADQSDYGQEDGY